MTDCQDDRARHGECPIGNDAELLVHQGSAEREQQHADKPGRDDLPISMAAEAKGEGARAQRDDDDQHLRMQMAFSKLTQKRCRGNQQRQGKAMHQAQTGQQDADPIQYFSRS